MFQGSDKNASGTPSDSDKDVRQKLSELGSTVKEEAGAKADAAKQKAAELADTAADKIRPPTPESEKGLGRKVYDMGACAAEKVTDTLGAVKDAGCRAVGKAQDGEPGAAAKELQPPNPAEDKGIYQKVTEMGASAIEKVKSSLGYAADTAQDAADATADKTKTVAEDAKRAGRDVQEAAADKLQSGSAR